MTESYTDRLLSKTVSSIHGATQLPDRILRFLGSEHNNRNQIKCKFDWNVDPEEWGGFNSAELVDLVAETADFMAIKPEDRKKVSVLFGDHIPFQDCYGEQEVISGVMLADWGMWRWKSGQIRNCKVIINRSLEVAQLPDTEYENEGDEVSFIEVDDDIDIADPEIYCNLQSPWEVATWVVAEELHHAAVMLRLKYEDRIEAAKEKYASYARGIFGDDFESDSYAFDIVELAASRQTVRFLAKQALKRGEPDRAAYFKENYQLSLESRMVVVPAIENFSAAFVSTGYTPQ